MSSRSNLQSLAAKLAEKRQADRLQIEAMTRSELDALAQSLKEQSNAALSTTLDAIEADLSKLRKQIEAQTKTLHALTSLTFLAWLKPIVISLSLLLGIFAGSWALMQWLSYSITSQLETQATLSQQIEQAKQTLAQIEAKTWGVELHQSRDGDRYVILPPGVEPVTGWKFGQGQQERQAVRLRLGKN